MSKETTKTVLTKEEIEKLKAAKDRIVKSKKVVTK